MLTIRGWMVLSIAAIAAFFGAIPGGRLPLVTVYAPIVPLIGLMLLLWMAMEWIRFQRAIRSAKGRISLQRQIILGERVVVSTWARASCTVRLGITLSSPHGFALCFCKDYLPEGRIPRSGSPNFAGPLTPGQLQIIEYTLRPRGPGVIRFEGLDIRIVDLAGLFYHREFIREGSKVLVLPPLVDDEGRQRANKKFNTLPPPGIHRLRRPGTGSELLDLRDYIPGDPPKMIAWKASARRDRLITKEFENDVPVRCLLFLDTSQSVRIGPPGDTPLCRLVEIASGVAQAASANRDIVGLTQFDESSLDISAPARTKVHTIRMLGKLAESAAKLPDPGGTNAILTTRHAYPLARELYPDLFAKELNSRPLMMYWKPLLDTRWGWLIFVPILLNLIAIVPLMLAFNWWLIGGQLPSFLRFFLPLDLAWLDLCLQMVRSARPQGPGIWKVLFTLVMFVIIWVSPIVLSGLFWLFFSFRGFAAPHSVRTKKRKHLGALFAALDADTPAAIERYIHDDEAFCKRAGRFMAMHQVRMPVALYGPKGEYLHRGESRAQVLASALMGTVARARDNELYVILADLIELGPAAAPLLKAIRIARSRHHHVLVIVPWPDGAPEPKSHSGPKSRTMQPVRPGKRQLEPIDDEVGTEPTQLSVPQLIKSSLIQGYLTRYEALRVELARVGATVIRVNEGDPVQVVLDRLDRVRGLRIRR